MSTKPTEWDYSQLVRELGRMLYDEYLSVSHDCEGIKPNADDLEDYIADRFHDDIVFEVTNAAKRRLRSKK